MAYDVTLITGDGTGPELAEAARRCVDATGVKIDWDVQEAGIDVMERLGTPLPQPLLDSLDRTARAAVAVSAGKKADDLVLTAHLSLRILRHGRPLGRRRRETRGSCLRV